MSGLESVVREQERMAKKQKLCRKQTLVDLEHVIKIVEATSEQLKAEGAYSHFIAEMFEMAYSHCGNVRDACYVCAVLFNAELNIYGVRCGFYRHHHCA